MEYDLQRRNMRTWRALFFFFFKTSLVNAYKLHTWREHPPNDNAEAEAEDSWARPNGAHRKFREALVTSLWEYAFEIGPYAPEELSHEWVKQLSRWK
jgi:hypothetical protein